MAWVKTHWLAVLALIVLVVGAVLISGLFLGCGAAFPLTSISPPASRAAQTVGKVFQGKVTTTTTTRVDPKTEKPVTETVKVEEPVTTESTTCESQSQGAGLTALNPDAPKSFSTGAVGDVNAGKGTGTEGVTASTLKGAISSSGGAWVLIIGSLAVIGGVVGATYLKLVPVGWYVAGAGIVLVGLGLLAPAWGGYILLGALGIGVVALGYYLYTHKVILTNVIDSVQAGVNSLSADAVAAFKAATSKKMDTATKEAVKEVKLTEGIEETPKTPPVV